jgi:DNA-directed RNA polymerase specialized sigma24 family protein
LAVRHFPDTRVSVVTELSSADTERRERAVATVIEVYRAPVIAVLRGRWNLEPADAEDLAHDFFAQALAQEWLSRYEPARGRFRTFLRTCLFAFASTAHEAATRQKRGGSLHHLSLDDAQHVSAPDDAGADFDREWIRSVLTKALAALHDECVERERESTWRVFSAYDVDGADGDRPTYDALARDIGIPPTQVTNYLSWARRRFREHVLGTLRQLTASESEYRDEVRELLGSGVR